MGDVTTDDADGWQLRVEEEQCGNPQGTRANRRNRDKYTEQNTDCDGNLCLLVRMCPVVGMFQRIPLQLLAENDRAGGKKQGDAE